jgi:hypothetical protein
VPACVSIPFFEQKRGEDFVALAVHSMVAAEVTNPSEINAKFVSTFMGHLRESVHWGPGSKEFCKTVQQHVIPRRLCLSA